VKPDDVQKKNSGFGFWFQKIFGVPGFGAGPAVQHRNQNQI